MSNNPLSSIGVQDDSNLLAMFEIKSSEAESEEKKKIEEPTEENTRPDSTEDIS